MTHIPPNDSPGVTTVMAGWRRGRVMLELDPRDERLGPSLDLELSNLKPLGFAGGWKRSGVISVPHSDRTVCARRLNADLDPEAPAVYRAVLDSIYVGFDPYVIVVAERVRPSSAAGSLVARSLPIDADFLRSFVRTQTIRPILLEDIGLDQPMYMLADSPQRGLASGRYAPSDSMLSSMSGRKKEEPFWLTLISRYYPIGLTQLGEVAFNRERTKAVVEIAHLCGSECYSSEIDLLLRAAVGWRVAERHVIPSLSNEGPSVGPLTYLGPNRRKLGPNAYDKDPSASLPRRVSLKVVDSSTRLPVVGYEVRAYSDLHPNSETVTTDSTGRVLFENSPWGELTFGVSCPHLAHRVGLKLVPWPKQPVAFVHPAIDTAIVVSVDSGICAREPGFVRLDTTAASSGRVLRYGYPSSEAAEVYRAAFRALRADSAHGGLLLLAPTTSHACTFEDKCGSLQLYRLEREGKVNAGTVRAFKSEAARRSPIDPRFWTDGPAAVMTDPQRKHLDSLANRFADVDVHGNAMRRLWAEVKHAFPGASELFTATRVGFSPDGREALLEISRDTLAEENTPELMLLRKSVGGWSVTRRHIERETTSGAWKNGSCEPVTPATPVPSLADLKAMRGIYELTTVSTHPDWAGQRYKTILSLWGRESAVDGRDYQMHRMDGLAYSPSDEKRSPKGADAVRISGRPGAVAATIGPQSMCFDCGTSAYWIHSNTATTFSGSAEYGYGLGFPTNKLGEPTRDGGYFYDKLPKLFPHAPKMRDLFASNPQLVELTARRNSSLQGAYMMIAARSLGLDVGPMSGYDASKLDEGFFGAGRECEGCDQEFFPEGHVKSNFLFNLGYGDATRLFPRSPRLDFEEGCAIL